jgi:hypothetical protein
MPVPYLATCHVQRQQREMIFAVAELVPHFVIISGPTNLSLHKEYIIWNKSGAYIRFECKLNSSDIILSSILQVICPPHSVRLLNVNVEVCSTIEAFDTLFT